MLVRKPTRKLKEKMEKTKERKLLMKNSIRVSAKTVDDAITEAIIQLGVTSDQLDYQVIEKGSAGFLGIGIKQAVIEAKRKDEKANNEEKPSFDLKSEKPDKGKKEGHQKSEKHKQKSKEDEKTKIKDFKKEDENKLVEEAKEETSIEAKEIVKVEITETTQKEVEKFLIETLKAMSLDVKATISVDEENTLLVDLEGDNMGVIIGKRGQTLDSLQYLANRVANKHQSEYVRVRVDTENYRARRDETLTRLAKNLAQKVKRTRRPVSLEPMNPYERRVIHSVLQSNPNVKTHSEGDEPYRKIVITPKRY
jgi:spoIIIJ-associated protein